MRKREANTDAERVPLFKQKPIFEKYIEYFIKVYKILYKNPYLQPPEQLGGDHIVMNLKLIPNEEILSKFLKTNFELVSGEMAVLNTTET